MKILLNRQTEKEAERQQNRGERGGRKRYRLVNRKSELERGELELRRHKADKNKRQRQINRYIDRQTDKDGLTERQTDRQRDRHTNRQTDRQADRQTDRQIDVLNVRPKKGVNLDIER